MCLTAFCTELRIFVALLGVAAIIVTVTGPPHRDTLVVGTLELIWATRLVVCSVQSGQIVHV